MEFDHSYIVVACFLVESLIGSFGTCFLEFNFAFEVDMGNFVGVDNIEEEVIA